MPSKNKIITKIKKIEKLLNEIKNELSSLETTSKPVSSKEKKAEQIPSREYLINEYDKLYQTFLTSNSEVVPSFVTTKSILYLKEFCKVNNVSIDSSKSSKAKIAEEIIRWFVQRRAISKRNK